MARHLGLLAQPFKCTHSAALRRLREALALLAAAVLAVPMTAQAALILQDNATTTALVEFYEPIGQSFTAEDASVSFAFYYETMNVGELNDPLELRLLSGDGLGGSVLGSFTFTLPGAACVHS